MSSLCPHCKTSTTFKGFIQKQATISMEGSSPVISKEDKNSSVVITHCSECDAAVKASELLKADLCQECNELVLITDLEDNSEGKSVCVACLVAGERSDLAEMTQSQLIRKLLEMEKQLKATTSE